MDFPFKQYVLNLAPLPRQNPVLPLPPPVSALPSLCTSYSNRNLIFQAIVVFLLPYFYCCCCCLDDHRLPLYADAPLPSPSLSLSLCISICLTLSCSPSLSLSACLSSSALCPHHSPLLPLPPPFPPPPPHLFSSILLHSFSPLLFLFSPSCLSICCCVALLYVPQIQMAVKW